MHRYAVALALAAALAASVSLDAAAQSCAPTRADAPESSRILTGANAVLILIDHQRKPCSASRATIARP